MEAIKIDPTAKYVIFVRDAPPEWAVTVEQSLREWFDSPSKVILVNVPGQGQVWLEKWIAVQGKQDVDSSSHQ